jgi:hypothetical protein
MQVSEQVVVPDADDMDDETFMKHVEARHQADYKLGGTTTTRYALQAWIGPWRAFHRRLHDLEVPGQYDHIHEDYL